MKPASPATEITKISLPAIHKLSFKASTRFGITNPHLTQIIDQLYSNESGMDRKKAQSDFLLKNKNLKSC